jgi:hypothetical protein
MDRRDAEEGAGNGVLEFHASNSKLMPRSSQCGGRAVDSQARVAPDARRVAATGGGQDRLGRIGALHALVSSSSHGITEAHVTEDLCGWLQLM